MKTCRWAVMVLLIASPARADSTGPADAEAERLAKEGQTLLEQGRVHEACDKLDLSLRREHNLNTLALLAICHEHDNKPGKAWNEFKRAEREAPPGEKAQIVAQHLKALETKVARARLEVGARAIAEVRVDSEPVVLEQAHVVTDPGAHTITVKVEGAGAPKSVSRNVQLALGDNPDVVFEFAEGQQPPPGAETPPPTDEASGRRTTGIVFTSLGVVMLGVGVGYGLWTLSIKKDADGACGPSGSTCTSQQAADEAEDRKKHAIVTSWISSVAIGLGAASVGYGIYLMLTAGGPSTLATAKVGVRPEIGPGSLGLRGSF
jgi:hypothetical protein